MIKGLTKAPRMYDIFAVFPRVPTRSGATKVELLDTIEAKNDKAAVQQYRKNPTVSIDVPHYFRSALNIRGSLK